MYMKVYATKDFPSTDNTLTVTLNGAFYRTAVATSVKVWVYNDCDTAVTVGGTSVAAKTGQFITISTGVSQQEIVVNIVKDGGMKTGDAIYFGNALPDIFSHNRKPFYPVGRIQCPP